MRSHLVFARHGTSVAIVHEREPASIVGWGLEEQVLGLGRKFRAVELIRVTPPLASSLSRTPSEWAAEAVSLPEAHRITRVDPTFTIAMLDTGIWPFGAWVRLEDTVGETFSTTRTNENGVHASLADRRNRNKRDGFRAISERGPIASPTRLGSWDGLAAADAIEADVAVLACPLCRAASTRPRAARQVSMDARGADQQRRPRPLVVRAAPIRAQARQDLTGEPAGRRAAVGPT